MEKIINLLFTSSLRIPIYPYETPAAHRKLTTSTCQDHRSWSVVMYVHPCAKSAGQYELQVLGVAALHGFEGSWNTLKWCLKCHSHVWLMFVWEVWSLMGVCLLVWSLRLELEGWLFSVCWVISVWICFVGVTFVGGGGGRCVSRGWWSVRLGQAFYFYLGWWLV